MPRPDPKKLKKMKLQDKELAGLPSTAEEKRRFKLGESKLANWLKRKVVPKKKVKALAKEAKQGSGDSGKKR